MLAKIKIEGETNERLPSKLATFSAVFDCSTTISSGKRLGVCRCVFSLVKTAAFEPGIRPEVARKIFAAYIFAALSKSMSFQNAAVTRTSPVYIVFS